MDGFELVGAPLLTAAAVALGVLLPRLSQARLGGAGSGRGAVLSLLALGLGIAVLVPVQDRLLVRQEQDGLAERSPFEAMEPGQFVGTVLIGGFRMMAIDALWYRYLKRMEERDFFEMSALAEVITKLQPWFEEVWIYHAWNLGYNLAPDDPDPEVRWKWLRQGLLFYQKGRRYNPGSWRLSYFMGWTIWHRCWVGAVDTRVFTSYAEERFRDDPLLNPQGGSVLEAALELFEAASAIDGHGPPPDYRSLSILAELYAQARAEGWQDQARLLESRLRGVVAHLYEVHGSQVSLEYLDGQAAQVEAMLVAPDEAFTRGR